MRSTQQVTSMLNSYLELKGYAKAAVARNAGIKPDDFYAMLTNKKIMTADHFVSVCAAIDTNSTEIMRVVTERRAKTS